MKQRRIVIVLAIVAASLVTGAWLLQREGAPPASAYQQARAFDDVLAHVADFYVDSIDEGRLYQMAIDGLLDQLHDPYSTFLKPDDFRSLSEQTSGNYGGLGLQIDVRDNWITVVAPLPDSPAERAGIQSGDLIVGLDGRSTEGWKNDQAVKELRGTPGTQVELKVRRAGVDQPLAFKLTRATIHMHSVQLAMMLDDHVGYIALSPVSESSAQEVQEAVDSLMKAGMKSLIFDLRGNPGGLLNQGIKVSELFLDPGQEVVSTRGRAPDANRVARDSDKQLWPQLPIVTLVNGGTASAAEIIAGALQDHDRSLVIGTPTFGKGLVQSLYPFTQNPPTALKLTTARWYTPSGRTIQRKSKSEEDQEAQVAAQAVAPNGAAGHDTTKVDSSLVFHTDMGRTVLGGGGIRPDIFVAVDTYTTAERNFMKALGNKIPIFRDVLSTYALELKAGHLVASPTFTVTPAMVNQVVTRLHARGALTSDSVVTGGARGLIADELGYEAARYSFGRSAEFRRRMGDDTQAKEALHFARQAKTPADLLASAPASSVQPPK
ncbi:MAG TPA: S41 family peptidase [Gemmatimonadales bacterium]|nr:S41 family peptidase [Gemmatimonadales bacterium]